MSTNNGVVVKGYPPASNGAPQREPPPPPAGRAIPANVQAELAVLGSCLINPDALGAIESLLTPADFYRERNGWIYQAMLDLQARREPVDVVLLAEELAHAGRLEAIGGPGYLTNLVADTPTAFYAVHYATIVKEASQRRHLIAAAGKIAELAYDEAQAISAVMDAAEQTVFGVAGGSTTRGLTHIRGPVQRVIDKIDRLSREGGLMGIPTGFTMLDNVLGGFQRTDLIILAARPGMGKSSMAFSFAVNAAARHQARVAVFSLEMSEEQSVERWLSMLSGIDAHRLRLGRVHENEWPTLLEAANGLSQMQLFIDDTAANSITDIRSRARRIHAEHGLDLLIVDYMQLMSSAAKSENRHMEISKFSKGLKALAKELNIPIIALSQLSRGVESRSDKRPMLSDLRESGAIEEDADVVMFLYREDYYNEESERPNVADLIIAKHRHGATGTIHLYFRKELTTFRDLETVRTELNP